MMDQIIGNKNPKNKPGFAELGSETPYDVAVKRGNTRVARLISNKIQEGKNSDGCDFSCPPINDTMNGKPIVNCYQPDLLIGIFHDYFSTLGFIKQSFTHNLTEELHFVYQLYHSV